MTASEVICGSYAELEVAEPFPGVLRRRFDASGATVSNYTFAPGASFPIHRHDQEQITLIDRGTALLHLPSGTLQLDGGQWSVIPGGVEHGITAGPGGATVTCVVVPRRPHSDAYEVLG